MVTILTANSVCIAALNDNFRVLGVGPGRFVFTQGVQALTRGDQMALLNEVRGFTDFSEDNDPYGEHDFGSIAFNKQKYYFKIDYYDSSYEYAAEDPCKADETHRVLTVMLASEY